MFKNKEQMDVNQILILISLLLVPVYVFFDQQINSYIDSNWLDIILVQNLTSKFIRVYSPLIAHQIGVNASKQLSNGKLKIEMAIVLCILFLFDCWMVSAHIIDFVFDVTVSLVFHMYLFCFSKKNIMITSSISTLVFVFIYFFGSFGLKMVFVVFKIVGVLYSNIKKANRFRKQNHRSIETRIDGDDHSLLIPLEKGHSVSALLDGGLNQTISYYKPIRWDKDTMVYGANKGKTGIFLSYKTEEERNSALEYLTTHCEAPFNRAIAVSSAAKKRLAEVIGFLMDKDPNQALPNIITFLSKNNVNYKFTVSKSIFFNCF